MNSTTRDYAAIEKSRADMELRAEKNR